MISSLLFFALLLMHFVAIVSSCHALLHKRDSSSALGWVALILLMPPAGLPLYWLFGIARVDSRAARIMEKAGRQFAEGRLDLPGELSMAKNRGAVDDRRIPVEFQRLVRPGFCISGWPLIGNNEVFPLHNGEEAYPAMLEAIDRARDSVWLSTFIFANDEVGERFAEALAQAAERGCDVRVIMDGIGSFHPFIRWSRRFGARVRLAYFLPPVLIPPQFSINLRTHRKMLICDSRIAFAGGMNISQNHLATLSRPDRVQDIHFCCHGPIALQVKMAFLLDWRFVTAHAARIATDPSAPLAMPVRSRFRQSPASDCPFGEFPSAVPPETDMLEETTTSKRRESLCRLLVDGPGSSRESIQDLFCAMISSATVSVRIMSPYFLPPQRLCGALVSAVLRGVSVSVIVPAENNHTLVDWAMRHQLPLLADRGIEVLYQPPPFAHTKLLLVDGLYTLMGSANLDPRSLSLNFELVMEIFDSRLAERLGAFYDDVRSRSDRLLPTDPLPPLPYRLRNAASWIFSPYL